MPHPQDRIGPYTLLQKIGRGGFGVVWLAEKRTTITTTHFALKLARDEEIDLDAFKQEAAVWVQASGHPHVLPIIEADIYDGQVVIVSEYAPDGSLTDWLKRHGDRAPSVDSAVEMALQILSGLEYLHEKGIIHRDIKPDNILLQRGIPRLADFGVARLQKINSYSQAVKGTPLYMAPEAFNRKRNEQTDVWSVGIVLYEMLAGYLPYEEPDFTSLIGAIISRDPLALPESNPESLRRVVACALQRDPSKRYKTAAAMRQALSAASREMWQSAVPTTLVIGPPVDMLQSDASGTIINDADTLSFPDSTDETSTGRSSTEPASPSSHVQSQERSQAASQLLRAPSKDLPRPSGPIAEPKERKAKSPWQLKAILAGSAVLIVLALVIWGIFYRRGVTQPTTPAPIWPKKLLASSGVAGVAFSPDGHTLASGNNNGSITLWDVDGGKLPRTLSGHKNIVWAVDFSPDGKILVSGSEDGSILLWDTDTGEGAGRLEDGHVGEVQAVDFSPDGTLVSSGRKDGIVTIWDLATREARKAQPAGHPGQDVRTVKFSPDGSTLASGSEDKTAILWNVETGKPMAKLVAPDHSAAVWAVDFSPDGKTLASGSENGTVILWDVDSGKFRRSLKEHGSAVYAVAFSPVDGTLLASGGLDRVIMLWNVKTFTRRGQPLTGHPALINTMAFSPDGKILASGSDDGMLILWKTEP